MQKKEVIRLADYENDDGLDFKDTIEKANKQNVRILSNLEIDKRLKSGQWEKEKEMYPCWTGTLVVYEEPGKAFGKTVECEGLIFNIPKKFQGKKNMAIVCNHPDFVLKENTITPGKSAKCIPIPEKDGWYLPEKQFGIPNGEKGNNDGHRSYLWRWSSPFVGLVSRCCGGWGGWDRRVVDASYGPYGRRGVFGIKGKCSAPNHKHEWVCRICGEVKK